MIKSAVCSKLTIAKCHLWLSCCCFRTVLFSRRLPPRHVHFCYARRRIFAGVAHVFIPYAIFSWKWLITAWKLLIFRSRLNICRRCRWHRLHFLNSLTHGVAGTIKPLTAEMNCMGLLALSSAWKLFMRMPADTILLHMGLARSGAPPKRQHHTPVALMHRQNKTQGHDGELKESTWPLNLIWEMMRRGFAATMKFFLWVEEHPYDHQGAERVLCQNRDQCDVLHLSVLCLTPICAHGRYCHEVV